MSKRCCNVDFDSNHSILEENKKKQARKPGRCDLAEKNATQCSTASAISSKNWNFKAHQHQQNHISAICLPDTAITDLQTINKNISTTFCLPNSAITDLQLQYGGNVSSLDWILRWTLNSAHKEKETWKGFL